MSEYQAIYDALTDKLDDPNFKQVFYDAVRDAVQDRRIEALETEIMAYHNPHTGEECDCDICTRGKNRDG